MLIIFSVILILSYNFLYKIYLFVFHPKIIFIIVIKIAPGIPSIPTNTDVNTLSPIWKLKVAPTILIIYINNPPKIELKINFKIVLIGIINILPNIKIKKMHAKYVTIVL